ncbi:MAG: ATPase, T2SS/T4P/T4SS family [Pseudonocardiaceae bacterium]
MGHCLALRRVSWGADAVTLRGWGITWLSIPYPPSRIIVGEVRQEECLDLLISLNSGLPGMCSIHANSAREAVAKMCTLPLLAGENVGHSFVVPTVASSVDLVVHTDTDHAGHRRVREIVGVPGRVEGDVIETADIFASRHDHLARADGFPPHPERFSRLGIDVAALLAGTTEEAPHTERLRRGA